jgi:surface carbohydrate biosynthesis protein
MRKYDFLFVYETKNREFEGICLLKYELERRGYSVAVVETWWTMQHLHRSISASVVVAFALYNDAQIRFACSFGRDYKTIVNLQWEQIYTNADEENLETLYHVSGRARDMIHIAWGPFTVDKLVNLCSVPAQNVKMTGHIAMDFIKPRFRGYYMEREELLQSYHISVNTKLLLFISSFSYISLPDAILGNDVYQNTGVSGWDFKEVSILSQKTLFQWLEDVLPRHPECTFIYRPHPAEIDNPELQKIERNILNFRVIRDYSVKQWITVADKVYTWYSTSAADAIFCRKSFEILRPVELPHNMELVLYNGGRFITTLQDFDRTIDGPDMGFPIKKLYQ